MRTLLVLTGAHGAGKSTVIRSIVEAGFAEHIKTFTTRKPRGADDNEYHFVEKPPAAEEVSWIIAVGDNAYGMYRDDLERLLPGEMGVTFFEPTQIDVLRKYRDGRPGLEIVIVGLDTVMTAEEQARRVGGNPLRLDGAQRIEQIRNALRSDCDLLLAGDEKQVVEAVAATCRILSGRGGILSRSEILPLVEAGSLIQGAKLDNIQTASYDLSLGQHIWCQGKLTDLTPAEPIFKIPAYSYAIVQAVEKAALPTFVVGQFDVRVGHFLSGIILSNGPQVDPGYRGDLFCMLFNASSNDKTLRLGDHFATLHFWTTTRSSDAYAGYYRAGQKIAEHMDPNVISSLGGRIGLAIEEKVEAMAATLRKEMPKDHATAVFGTMGILVALVGALAIWAAGTVNSANSAITELKAWLGEAKAAGVPVPQNQANDTTVPTPASPAPDASQVPPR